LGAVFDYRNIEGEEGVEVGGLAEEMRGDNGPGAVRDEFFHVGGADVEGFSVTVRKHRRGAGGADGVPKGGANIAWNDDLVAPADPEGQQGQMEGHCTGADGRPVEGAGGAWGVISRTVYFM